MKCVIYIIVYIIAIWFHRECQYIGIMITVQSYMVSDGSKSYNSNPILRL